MNHFGTFCILFERSKNCFVQKRTIFVLFSRRGPCLWYVFRFPTVNLNCFIFVNKKINNIQYITAWVINILFCTVGTYWIIKKNMLSRLKLTHRGWKKNNNKNNKNWQERAAAFCQKYIFTRHWHVAGFLNRRPTDKNGRAFFSTTLNLSVVARVTIIKITPNNNKTKNSAKRLRVTRELRWLPVWPVKSGYIIG